MFPWRTINGEEASAYYAAGTAQYHINADIMYALRKYVQVTGDECSCATAVPRCWWRRHALGGLGLLLGRKGGKFCINGVTGPDEYNAVVNNNAYTNLMARENLRYATETVEVMRNGTGGLRRAGPPHGLERGGDRMEQAAENMYLP